MTATDEKEKKPWVVWRYDPKCRADDCQCCGYFWGAGHEKKVGQRARWPVTAVRMTGRE